MKKLMIITLKGFWNMKVKPKTNFYYIEHFIYKDDGFIDTFDDSNFFAESTNEKNIVNHLKKKIKDKKSLRIYNDDPYFCFDFIDKNNVNHLYRIYKINTNDYLDDYVYKIEIHKIDSNGIESNVYDLLNPDFIV